MCESILRCSYCQKEVKSLRSDLCNSCYQRKWRYGTLERKGRYDTKIERTKRIKSSGKVFPCLSCGAKVKGVYTKGLCHACYQRLRRNGTVEYKRKRNDPDNPLTKPNLVQCYWCMVESSKCVKGLCPACYHRKWRTGKLEYAGAKSADANCTYCARMDKCIDGLCKKCRAYKRKYGTLERRRKAKDRKTCSHCGVDFVRAKNLCSTCYSSLRVLGHLPHKIRRTGRDARQCQQCKSDGVYAKGLCRSCYNKQHRHDGDGKSSTWQRPCNSCGKPCRHVSGQCYVCRKPRRSTEPRSEKPKCPHCGIDFVKAQGLCGACYSSLKNRRHLPKTFRRKTRIER